MQRRKAPTLTDGASCRAIFLHKVLPGTEFTVRSTVLFMMYRYWYEYRYCSSRTFSTRNKKYLYSRLGISVFYLEENNTSTMDESGNHSSAAETLSKENHGESITGQVLVEWRDVDYRGFVFVLHKAYGLMLLRCTRKMNKGPHWQIPGGHIDKKEFLDAGKFELSWPT